MNLSRSIAIHSKHSEVLESLLEKKKIKMAYSMLDYCCVHVQIKMQFSQKVPKFKVLSATADTLILSFTAEQTWLVLCNPCQF